MIINTLGILRNKNNCDLILYFIIMREFKCNVVDPQITTNLKNLKHTIFIKNYINIIIMIIILRL